MANHEFKVGSGNSPVTVGTEYRNIIVVEPPFEPGPAFYAAVLGVDAAGVKLDLASVPHADSGETVLLARIPSFGRTSSQVDVIMTDLVNRTRRALNYPDDIPALTNERLFTP